MSFGELVRRRAIGPEDERLHLVEPGVDEVLRLMDPSPVGDSTTSREGAPAHDSGRPSVAEHTALVPDSVSGERLVQQLVEFLAMLDGNLFADLLSALLGIGLGAPPARGGRLQ